MTSVTSLVANELCASWGTASLVSESCGGYSFLGPEVAEALGQLGVQPGVWGAALLFIGE